MSDETGTRDAPPRSRSSRRRRRRSSANSSGAASEAPANRPEENESEPREGAPRRRRRRRRSGRGSGEGGGGGGGGGGGQPRESRDRQPDSRQSDSRQSDGGGGNRRRKRRRTRSRGEDPEVVAARRRRRWKRDVERDPDAQPEVDHPDRDPFHELVSIDPDERFELEIEPTDIEMRVVDILTPIGKGQRGLIVAPPKTGKTTLLMQLQKAIAENHPEVELIVMLVDERPEEVTAFRRAGFGTVMSSSNDEPVRSHLRLTQNVLRKAKQWVLEGKDVCILLDSITRMARAHNIGERGSHRTLSGGLDARALERPKRFFGSARNILDGGSLTILATALIDTGSRQDEVIFQEFKGTGNSELQLDRRLAERRVWPAIDIPRSGTRKEEKLFPPDEMEGVNAIRRALSSMHPVDAMQMLVGQLKKYKTNREFLLDCGKRAAEALT
ncbi:MAG: transcription termination factor Rho [Acidobacteriota bacterium]